MVWIHVKSSEVQGHFGIAHNPGYVVHMKSNLTPSLPYTISKPQTYLNVLNVEVNDPRSPLGRTTTQDSRLYSPITDVLSNLSSATVTGNVNDSLTGKGHSPFLPRLSAEIQIAFYTIIFILAFVGNLLIIITLIQNKRMRTVTNVYLLNLAVSDLLLAVVCMPFTLVPVLLMDFIFGKFMCIFIRYLQAVSVGVSCFTLVAISLERYFAICRPLHSRSWQTLSHAYRCIAVCWLLSAVLMTPTAVFQKHTAIGNGAHRCREIWPNQEAEQTYTVMLDLALLVLPVLVMGVAYSRVVHVLIFDVRSSLELHPATNGNGNMVKNYRTIELRLLSRGSCRSVSSFTSTETCMSDSVSPCKNAHPKGSRMLSQRSRPGQRSAGNRIRHSNSLKIRQNKMRVIRMLFAVVLEFFICWAPVYIIQTWIVFHSESAYQMLTPLSKNLVHLVSYVSSCCNPITYCFMNKKFREAFLRVFQCRSSPQSLRERRMERLHNYYSEHSARATTVLRLSNDRHQPATATTTEVLQYTLKVTDHGNGRRKDLTSSVEELNSENTSE
ncbi:hypothetical protein BsWGS_27133 [Bradybaena similaris]